MQGNIKLKTEPSQKSAQQRYEDVFHCQLLAASDGFSPSFLRIISGNDPQGDVPLLEMLGYSGLEDAFQDLVDLDIPRFMELENGTKFIFSRIDGLKYVDLEEPGKTVFPGSSVDL